MGFTSIIFGLILTAVAYMAFPIIRLLINGCRFTPKRAHKISLWNSIVLGAVFCFLTIVLFEDGTVWNASPAVLYYWINKLILTDKNATEIQNKIKDDCPKEQTNNISLLKTYPVVSRPPQISNPNEIPKNYGDYSVPLNDLALQQPQESIKVFYCRKCGRKLLVGSKFCSKCGTEVLRK